MVQSVPLVPSVPSVPAHLEVLLVQRVRLAPSLPEDPLDPSVPDLPSMLPLRHHLSVPVDQMAQSVPLALSVPSDSALWDPEDPEIRSVRLAPWAP